jgi:hypothetical protein
MIEKRLRELRGEWAKGVEQLELLDRRRAGLRDTMLRIEGAIQALEELAASDAAEAAPDRPALARSS